MVFGIILASYYTMLPPVFTAIAILVSGMFARHADDTARMVRLFAAGNAAEIAQNFNASVQLTTPGKEGVYSKSQAKMILSDFFSSHAPESAKLTQQGKSENGAHFMALNLKTATADYKVTLFYRGSGNAMRIHELKIEK